ncbi:site-2 protease family protein [Lutispora thermophila]|uniref:Zn-dependent protease (Includes SpoIVFB) n=1 Tax=Lutispora thermophila DSM 19022 TaxID=1122184 RepID=A0A1M6F6X2_9FIRM|nr:site-2 protease family protein [Lutispora thermophila]SHI93413.1 Zn-dependent protease (includes SpoIVFB) [Lutispora thermophila DSM 19022]
MPDIGFMSILYRLPAVFIGFSFHEFAHALVAYLLGDDTARSRGRLTLDPMAHIDPLGIIMLIFFRFGWAKPIPVNPSNFKNRKKGMVLVSLAGPIMNFIIAFVALLTYVTLYNFYGYISKTISMIIINIYLLNLGLGIFNLIPLPPLDGSKILSGLLPFRLEYKMYQYEQHLNILLLLLIVTNGINYLLNPMFIAAETVLYHLIDIFL